MLQNVPITVDRLLNVKLAHSTHSWNGKNKKVAAQHVDDESSSRWFYLFLY